MKGILAIAGLLLLLIFVLPWTSTGARESLSVTYGGWVRWYPGYTDAGNWIPAETEITIAGSKEELLEAAGERDPEALAQYLESNPNDLELCALVIRRTLLKHDLHNLWMSENALPERRDEYSASLLEARRLMPEVIQYANEGERQEPDNAFFPIARSIAFVQLGDNRSALASIQKATACKYYRDYSFELSKAYDDARPSMNPYIRFYDHLNDRSTMLWEVRVLGLRWPQLDDTNNLELRKYMLDLCPMLAASVKTAKDIRSVRLIVRDCAETDEVFKRVRANGRSPNEGDLYRSITNAQNEMIAAGMPPRVDAPSFYGVEEWIDLSRYGLSAATGIDWGSQAWMVLYAQETYVIQGASALYALFLLGVYAALSLALSKLLRFRLPELGFASLAALILAALDLTSGETNDGLLLVLVCFSAGFVCSFWPKLAKASICLGASGCIFAIFREVYIAEYPQWARANVPVTVFVIGALRYYWLIGKPRSRGVWLALPLVLLVVWGLSDLRFKSFGWHDVGLAAIVLPLVLVLISLWYQVQLSEASKKVLRSIPIAGLIAVLVFGFCAFRQYLLVNEMADLAQDQESLVANWKKEVAKVGPPIVGIATH